MSRLKKLESIDFKIFVDIFNTHGKKAAIKHVTETYGVRYDTIVKRLRLDSEYTFDQSRDKYILKSDSSSENPFLTVEELCHNDKYKTMQTDFIDPDKIISNLIKDKFFEVSKYVTLENSNRKIILKLDAARAAGYDIEYV
ncbi:MAG TPA: hypothetical protein VIO64_17635 [Pseudobacteroides sp.]|uniref:hypothetical protein n=1 Tax=Pseudobacteroides sp. TaxID=1968840 RepID=UPI002F92F3FC